MRWVRRGPGEWLGRAPDIFESNDSLAISKSQRIRGTAVVLACLLFPAFGMVTLCPAEERAITALVPADNLVVYFARPYGEVVGTKSSGKDGEPRSAPGSSIATILSVLSASGFIPDEGQVYADIATALPLLGRFEHALILLDASSRIVRRPGGQSGEPARLSLRLKHLKTAVVFRTNGRHRIVLEHLNRVMKRYTNEEVAKLTSEKVAGQEFQRLVDGRLPGWAIWEWGRLGDFFVVSFGEGAFEKIARTYSGQNPALSDDPWFRSATAETKGDQALAGWFLALERIERRLGEAAQGRCHRVISALEADDITRDLWTVGLQGRALSWYRCYDGKGGDVVHRYSDPGRYPRHHRRIVPDAARHFAIINVPTRWLVDNLPRAWLGAQSERDVQKWTRIWRGLEQETGIDLSGNLIDHLGNHMVIFDYPTHPLEIPFALTIAIEIDERKPVKMATDALLAAWGQYLDERAERKGSKLFRVYVKKAPDDIWFLEAGIILGPALKVTDRYLVVSWSPQALRDALKFIEAPPAGSPTKTAEGAN